MNTLKEWIFESFKVVPNKNLGKQDFGLGRSLPYKDSLDEVVVFNSMKDYNALSFVFNFPASTERMRLKTTYLIGDLLQHEGKGSLYAMLKEQGLIERIYTDDSTSFRTLMHYFLIEFRLTDKGMKNWLYVTKLTFDFLAFSKK